MSRTDINDEKTIKRFLAIDMGASSGRHIVGWKENGEIKTREVYRFENGMKRVDGHLCWDTEETFGHIIAGMRKCKELNLIPESVAIDTWGVDFVLLDEHDRKLGWANGYRDSGNSIGEEAVGAIISEEDLYRRTGIQKQSYNTVNQLMYMKDHHPDIVESAQTMLMTPDFYNFLLTGVKKQEFTMATTTQLVSAETGSWDDELISMLGLPREIFLPIEQPGTLVGRLTQEIQEQVGYDCSVIAVASHDTASAVATIPDEGKENALFISSGTWSLMGIYVDQHVTETPARLAGFTNEGGDKRSTLFIKNIMGLWIIQSLRKEMAPEMSYAKICEQAEKEKIESIVDCNHQSFFAPASMTETIRSYCKRTGQEVPESLGELAKVVYQSLAASYGETKLQIEELTGRKFERLYIIGGGSNAAYLNELTGLKTGCDIIIGYGEATGIGNLMLQMERDNYNAGNSKTEQEEVTC